MENAVDNGVQEFVAENRAKVNRYLNRVLWLFSLAGPAIAAGIGAGVFSGIKYSACAWVSAVMLALAAAHRLMLRRSANSAASGLFALAALNLLVAWMSVAHIAVRLTWFLVPLLSLLFCERFIYFCAAGLNFALMTLAVWLTSRGGGEGFLTAMGGYTIESLVMLASGYIILKLTAGYYTGLYSQYRLISEQERAMKEKMDVLDSMAEIYDNVNLIDFTQSTEMSLRDPEQKKHGIDMRSQTHTLMNQRIKSRVVPEHLEAFLIFTNITTVRERLRGKKVIGADFLDSETGWFRAQYITADAAPDGAPNVVIYTIRSVDEDKKREEQLIHISLTDEMTRLFNRRCYEEDLASLGSGSLPDDLVLFAVDVNGLKTVNDTLGHAAGDELIRGAADCLASAVGKKGRAYRTGGDEFMAAVHTDEPEALRARITAAAAGWSGKLCGALTLAVGYAAARDCPGGGVADLEHRADADMYAEKERYYRESGLGAPRGQGRG